MTPDETAQLASAELRAAKANPPGPRLPRDDSDRHPLPERLALRHATSIETTLVLGMIAIDRADPRLYLFHFDLQDWPSGDPTSAGGGVHEVLMRCTENPDWRRDSVPVSRDVAVVPVPVAAYRQAGMLTPANDVDRPPRPSAET